jgi:hypothetical protein
MSEHLDPDYIKYIKYKSKYLELKRGGGLTKIQKIQKAFKENSLDAFRNPDTVIKRIEASVTKLEQKLGQKTAELSKKKADVSLATFTKELDTMNKQSPRNIKIKNLNSQYAQIKKNIEAYNSAAAETKTSSVNTDNLIALKKTCDDDWAKVDNTKPCIIPEMIKLDHDNIPVLT